MWSQSQIALHDTHLIQAMCHLDCFGFQHCFFVISRQVSFQLDALMFVEYNYWDFAQSSIKKKTIIDLTVYASLSSVTQFITWKAVRI